MSTQIVAREGWVFTRDMQGRPMWVPAAGAPASTNPQASAPRAWLPATTAEIDASWKASVQRVFGTVQPEPKKEAGR